MSFDQAYSEFILHHLQRRKGEAKRRLRDGHGQAEKMFLSQVWWPALGNFNQLHPEFAVQDFQVCFRYLEMGLWFGDMMPRVGWTSEEKEIIRLAKQKGGHITPREVSAHLGVCRRTAQKQLHQLLCKQLSSRAQPGSIRIRSYRLLPTRLHI